MNWPILSVVTFLPLLGALLVAFLVRGNERMARGTARWIALWATLVTFASNHASARRQGGNGRVFMRLMLSVWLRGS